MKAHKYAIIKTITFLLKDVIVRPTKIIRDLCKANLCTGYTEVLNNFGSGNDMVNRKK